MRSKNEYFRCLLAESDCMRMQNLVPALASDVSPSPQARKNVEKLVYRQSRPYWRYVNTGLKRVAVVICILAILTCAVMSIPGVRESFANSRKRFFVSRDDGGVVIELRGDDQKYSDNIVQRYTLTALPDSFTVAERTDDKMSVITTWSDGVQRVSLEQISLATSRTFVFDTEDLIYEVLNIDGYAVHYSHNDGYSHTMAWITESYAFVLRVRGTFDESEVIELVKTMDLEGKIQNE